MSKMRIWSAWAASAGMAIAIPVNAQKQPGPTPPQAATQATVTLPAAPPPDGGTVRDWRPILSAPMSRWRRHAPSLAVQQDRTDVSPS